MKQLTPKGCRHCLYNVNTIVTSNHLNVEKIVFSTKDFFERMPRRVPLLCDFHRIFCNRIVQEIKSCILKFLKEYNPL